MAEIKTKVVSVGKVTVKAVEGEGDGERRITFVASSNNQDRHYESVDVGSLRLPLKGGGDLVVDSIPAEGVSDLVDIPLMLNHSGDVRDVIGSVRKVYYQNGELIFECGISSIEEAQTMLTLLEEGHLNNAFSITMCDYDYNFDSETISNAEIIEVSLVYRGANKEARLLAIKSLLGGEMDESEKAKVAETTPQEEPTKADKPTGAETEATDKTTDSEVAETEEATKSAEETEAKTEPEKTEDNTNDKSQEGEPAMKEIAKEQVVEKATTPVQVTKNEDYLKSSKSMSDFATILKEYAGAEASEVKKAWEAKLKEKGLSEGSDKVLLPDQMIQAIADTVQAAGGIFATFNHTGLTVRRVAVNKNGIDDEKGRAKGHKKGTDKGEEEIDLIDRVIRGQYIYKYLTLNKEDIRENQDTGALVSYVLTELPQRVIAEIERAHIIGDGRSDDNTKITSIVSLAADAKDGTIPFVTAYKPVEGDPFYKTVIKAMAQIEAEGDVYLVMSKAAKADLILSENNGGLVFPLGSDIKSALGVKDIFTPSWMNETNDKENQAYLYVGSAIDTVGDKNLELFTNFALKQNKQEYLEEVYYGGAAVKVGSAVAIAKDAQES